MSCFNENKIIRSDYVVGSEGIRRLFFRKKGALVSQQADCGYIASKDALIVQWEGSPTVDSGYSARHFPPTMAGLKQAHAEMDGLGS